MMSPEWVECGNYSVRTFETIIKAISNIIEDNEKLADACRTYRKSYDEYQEHVKMVQKLKEEQYKTFNHPNPEIKEFKESFKNEFQKYGLK